MGYRRRTKGTTRPPAIPKDYTEVRFNVISDPGHGWVKVSHVLIEMLGIQYQISRHSHRTRYWAFLEEDADAGHFIKAFTERFGQCPKFQFYTINDEESVIRGFTPYTHKIKRTKAKRRRRYGYAV